LSPRFTVAVALMVHPDRVGELEDLEVFDGEKAASPVGEEWGEQIARRVRRDYKSSFSPPDLAVTDHVGGRGSRLIHDPVKPR
jgi:hypothetical protein